MDENDTTQPASTSATLLPALHTGLLQLIQKNKMIPHFLNHLSAEDPNLRCLKKAISVGNFRSKIWNNLDCNLYLIYLIQNQRIPFWQGITAYVYLLAKMQYTTTQALRQEDHDVKLSYQVAVVPLVKAGKITEEGYLYLVGVVDAMERVNDTAVDFQELVNYILKLPRIEQWLIQTEYDHHHHSILGDFPNDADRLVWILIENLPLMQKISGGRYEDATTNYLIPSSSLINYFLKLLNKQPLRMRPILGDLGLDTLHRWHCQGFHPVSLYAPQIVSNPKNADGFRCGPFPMWLHDIGHTFWGSMLTKGQRDSLFTDFIPALRRLTDMANACSDDKTREFLTEAERVAGDFDLTAISYYQDLETRFDLYLAHTIGKNPIYDVCVYTGMYEYEAIGQAEGDRFYFLLHYGLHAAETPKPFKEIYQTLIRFITTGKNYREQRIIKALQKLAKQSATDSDTLFAHGPPLGNWNTQTWQRLLSSSRTSAEIWFSLTGDADLAEELLQLIELGLNFFDPYLPMVTIKKQELLDYFKKQPANCPKISKDPVTNANMVSTLPSQFFKSVDNDTGEFFFAPTDDEQLKYN